MDKITNLKLYDETVSPFGREYEFDLNYLLNAIKENKLNVDKSVIEKAFEFCYKYHSGTKRISGSPFYTHPLAVALILIEELKIPDTSIIATSLLYDMLRYVPNFDKSIIAQEFGETIATLSEATASFTRKNKNSNLKLSKAEILHKLFVLIVKDVRIFLIKLCDRLHNVRTLQYLSPSKQVEIAKETLNFFTPFAHRLGLNKLQNELERYSFYFYNYTQYNQILDFLKVKKKTFTEYMYILVDVIKAGINELNIPHKINVMYKQEYEIFLLMQNGNKIEDIDDIFSIEIELDSQDTSDCLRIHKHLVDKFSTIEYIDLLNNPIINFDNSISTELFGLNGRVHTAIRTQAMKENALGIIIQKIIDNEIPLAGTNISDEEIELWTNWMNYVIEVKESEEAAQLIFNSIKNNIYDEKISVSAKDGQELFLPKLSSVIDFAFALSYEIGFTLLTCKINGVIKNIFTELKNGDRVEVITSSKSHPDSSWLNHVITFKAQVHLTNYLKTSFKLRVNSNDANISRTDKQLIRITGINNNNMLSQIKDIIGQQNIMRIALSPNSNIFEIAVQTNFPKSKINNELFLSLIDVNGIKSVSIN